MRILITWFAKNKVAANLIMMVIIALGCLALPETRKELIPGVSLERIAISTLYPGAAPREVEAIVVGESIFTEQATGNKGVEGAIEGAYKVAKPITFAIITSVIAFMPLLFLPGPEGKLMQVIPVVVITTLLFSLFESLFILPAHLSHQPDDNDTNKLADLPVANKSASNGSPSNLFATNLSATNYSTSRLPPSSLKWFINKIKMIGRLLEGIQTRFSAALETFVIRQYKPFLDHVLRWRWSYILGFLGLFFISLTLFSSGWLRTVLFSAIEGDIAYANITFAEGSNPQKTKLALLKLNVKPCNYNKS